MHDTVHSPVKETLGSIGLGVTMSIETGGPFQRIWPSLDGCPPKAKVTRSNRVGCANKTRHILNFGKKPVLAQVSTG